MAQRTNPGHNPVSRPEPPSARSLWQILQTEVKAESVSPQFRTLSAQGSAPAPESGKSARKAGRTGTVFLLTPDQGLREEPERCGRGEAET